MLGKILSLPIKYKNPKYTKTIIITPLNIPKTKPKILSKNKKLDIENFGDNHFDIICEIKKAVKKGKPNAIMSIIIFWFM